MDDVGAKADRARSRSTEDTRFDRFAALVVLTLFGLTWPILDLLGRNAEFFLARRSAKTEIVLLALTAVLVIPVVVGLLGSLPGATGRRLGLGLIALTAASVPLLYLDRTALAWWLAVAGAFTIGVGLAWAFTRFGSLRQAARYLMLAPLVMLGVFFFSMPVGDVLWEPNVALGNSVAVANPAPVVMLVFDEFPVASLIDPEGNLRGDRYPNFARLADDGRWYRNAVTVEQQTEHSVPAMLTGRIPDQSLVPVAGQYPFNLFTALSSVYDLHVHEAITQLCPRDLCEGTIAVAAPLISDVSVVAGHVLLPSPLADSLPAIDRGWGDFGAAAGDFDVIDEFQELLAAGPSAPIDSILSDIAAADPNRRNLFYMHAILPHHPWQFLPDGRRYPFIVGLNPASVNGGWSDDDFLVAQSMQRHLLQVGYVDHALGRIMDALKTKGIYDDALVIVVADHGIAIKPGVFHQRIITETSVGDIAPIPLFVKLPHDSGGLIDDRRALTIDILATIAGVIGADLPDDVDGVSLLQPAPGRDETTTYGTQGPVTYGVSGEEKLEVARRIAGWFRGGDPWALRPAGSPDLAGMTVDFDEFGASRIRVHIKEPEIYQDVDTEGEVIPSRIGGTLVGDVDGDEVLAVCVNGVVGAVTRSYRDDGEIAFLAMVPPGLFVDGPNEIQVLEVTDGGNLLAMEE